MHVAVQGVTVPGVGADEQVVLRVAPYPRVGGQRRRIRREQNELEARVAGEPPRDGSVRGEAVPHEGHRSSQRALHVAHETLDGVGVEVAAEQVEVAAMRFATGESVMALIAEIRSWRAPQTSSGVSPTGAQVRSATGRNMKPLSSRNAIVRPHSPAF